jgi:phytoene dehydrogenase-like protein
MSAPVVIVGAGLAGLCCGRRLAQCGVPFTVLEASDGVGGRVRTDLVDGFRLDRGFQIFLPAYPEARRVLDYDRLDLKPFTRGALVRWKGKFHRVADPRSEPLTAAGSLLGPVGGPLDKLRLVPFQWHVSRDELEAPTAPEKPALALFRHDGGFSEKLIDRLLRPFLGGVTLDKGLTTSSRFVRFVWRVFAAGGGAVPANGMGEIPRQVADALPAGSVRLNSPVAAVAGGAVHLASGEALAARAVVVATDATTAHRLLWDDTPAPGWNGSTTLHYATDRPPTAEPILMLDGEGRGPVNTVVVMSAAAPAYAPAGQHLVTASVVGVPETDHPTLDAAARRQLGDWFGESVAGWRLLRVDRIADGLPQMPPGSLTPWRRPVAVRDGVFVCGDHRDNGSIDGAMASGFRAAQAVMELLPAAR